MSGSSLPRPGCWRLVAVLLTAGLAGACAVPGRVHFPHAAPAPAQGNVRLSMLTPSGIHFGEGDMNVLSADPMGGPVIAAAAQLLSALVDKTQTQGQ